jgi:preprotein translocase subunit SecD
MKAERKEFWLLLALILSLGFGGCGGCGSPTLAGSGGYVLTYHVPENVEHDGTAMVTAIESRLRGFGIHPANVRAGGQGAYTIELPGADDARLAEVRSIIGSTGSLEMQIVAERGVHDAQIDAAESVEDAPKTTDPAWRWVRLDPKFEPDPKLITRPRDDGGQDVW